MRGRRAAGCVRDGAESRRAEGACGDGRRSGTASRSGRARAVLAVRCGAVRCGAVRCGAVRCGMGAAAPADGCGKGLQQCSESRRGPAKVGSRRSGGSAPRRERSLRLMGGFAPLCFLVP